MQTSRLHGITQFEDDESEEVVVSKGQSVQVI
jgi:hypothetical protein